MEEFYVPITNLSKSCKILQLIVNVELKTNMEIREIYQKVYHKAKEILSEDKSLEGYSVHPYYYMLMRKLNDLSTRR